MIYALDTNIIIDYINGETVVKTSFTHSAKSQVPIIIPSVVNYEVLRGFYHTPNIRKEAVYESIRQNCLVIEANADIWECAAKIWAALRKKGLTVGDTDIIIASTCITNGYTLITHNTKHFSGIDGLKISDWVQKKC